MPPRRPPVPVDDHPVGGRLDLAAERSQRRAHGLDPVGLLAAQLGGIADRRRPLGEAGGERDQRQLVDRQRDLGAADLGPAQWRRADPQAGGRLAPAFAHRLGLDLGPHPLEDRQQAGPGWVDADPLQHHLAVRDQQPGDDEEGGGGDVGGDGDLARFQARGRAHGDGPALAADLGPGGGQHPLAVVAARVRLDDARLALGQQSGEQQAGLHLGAGDRHLVGDPLQRRGIDPQRRQPLLAGAQAGPHLPQRDRDPVDRALADRVVAVERPRADLLPGQPARQQPQQGAGVADVDRRRARTAQPDPLDPQLRPQTVGALDPGPEGLDGAQGRVGVGGVEIAVDRRRPLPHRRDQRRPVGDRLVRGRAQAAAQGSRGLEAGVRHPRAPYSPSRTLTVWPRPWIRSAARAACSSPATQRVTAPEVMSAAG